MGSIPLHYVDLRAFCYVTEDPDRVEAALRLFLPEEAEIDRDTSEGHHGDPIEVLSTRLETADDVRVVIDRLAELDDPGALRSELEARVDENCSFFLSLDKQAASRGTVRLGDGITLRAKVEAYPATRERAVENLGAFLESEFVE